MNSFMLNFLKQVIHAVLQVLNLITDDNVELLESACRAGLVSLVVYFVLCLVHACARNWLLYCYSCQFLYFFSLKIISRTNGSRNS